ncbi:YggT family protein [Nocardioides sp. CER19]|uniref:YggT family protein n=1 Tax=Nocardioides sp. CER19 TaxID=3038538 RepID=UPI00244A200C|nr:YggT family protein [Nocardioides sp. CER19]MDH2416014.1 YggT family protein [Nocardioides sp. CER19]
MTVPPVAAPRPARPAHPQRRLLLLGLRTLVWVVYAYVVVTEVVLTLGFVLLLFGANPDASFVAWVYRSLDRAMEPFRGMFTPIHLNVSANDDVRAVLDTSVLFAMIVYAFAAWAVHAVIEWLTGLIRTSEQGRQYGAEPSPWQPATGMGPGAASSAPSSAPSTAHTTASPPGPAPGPTYPPPSAPPSAPPVRG